jgi:hypothetical protein
MAGKIMSQLHQPRADDRRRRTVGAPAITLFARAPTTVARLVVLLSCGLGWLALGPHWLRADTLSRAHGSVVYVGFESMQEGEGSVQAGPLFQPRRASAAGDDPVAFPAPSPGDPLSGDVDTGPLDSDLKPLDSGSKPLESESKPLESVPARLDEEVGVASPACELQLPPISAVTTDIRPPQGDLPFDCARPKLPPTGVAAGEAPCRQWPQILYPWEATGYCHRPLYFEEVNLERYGYLFCDDRCGGVPAGLVQPVLSGAHFFATVPLLPYTITAEPPCECIYTLGEYRPGSPVPYQIHRLPLRPLAGGAEACAITGLIFAVP